MPIPLPAVVTAYFTLASLRTSVVVFIIFFSLEIVFILLTAAYYMPPRTLDGSVNYALVQAGGWQYTVGTTLFTIDGI